MSYGFLAVNDNNQVLVSSDTRNLHFIQKLTGPRNDTISTTDADAGIIYTTDYFGGVRHWRYTVTCATTPVPFFTMPTTDYYGVVRVQNKGDNRWDIEVIRSGTSTTVPELYIFADPRASTSSESHGMIVYLDDGTAAFDSRLKPLAVTGGKSLTHPANPKDSFGGGNAAIGRDCSAGIDTRSQIFIPTNYNEFSISTESMTKPMYFYASLAQAERESTWTDSTEECTGFSVYGNCLGYQTNQNWTSHYWAFYRGGISYSTAGLGPYIAVAGSKATLGLTQTATPNYYWLEYVGYVPDGTYTYTPAYTTYTNTSSNFTGSIDDGYWALDLPWSVRMNNSSGDGTALYTKINVATNSYVTFGVSGFTNYSDLQTPTTLPSPKLMLMAADNCCANIFTTVVGSSPNREFVVRYEGYNATSVLTIPPNLKWELTFYENNPNIIDVKFDGDIASTRNSSYTTGPVFAVGSSSSWTSGGALPFSNTNTVTQAAVRLQPAAVPVIRAGWIPVTVGCWYTYNSSSALLGINTGGGSGSGGVWPYTNETLNLSSNTLITADASRYD
jgi:hypothetical protein